MKRVIHWILDKLALRLVWFKWLAQIQNLYYQRGYDQGRFSEEAQTLWQKAVNMKCREDIQRLEAKVNAANLLVKDLKDHKDIDSLSKKTERLIEEYERFK